MVSFSAFDGQLEAQLLKKRLVFMFATGFVTGCVFLGVVRCLSARGLAKTEKWPELFLTRLLSREA